MRPQHAPRRALHLIPALAVALVATVTGFAAPASAAGTTINTIPSWDGSTYISSFGRPDTSTYGQVITVPAGQTSLSSFSFELQEPSAAIFRGEVYAWDAGNSRATGASLWESAPRSTTQGDSFEKVTFTTGGVPVTAGQQYVIFATVSRDEQPDAYGGWGYVDNSTYAGGSFVFQNNGTDVSQWTSSPWTVYDLDLAFQAQFGTVVTKPKLTVTPGTVSRGDSATVLGQGLVPGQRYDIQYLGQVVKRTADDQGEVHYTLDIPLYAPIGTNVVTLSGGASPVIVLGQTFTVRRGTAVVVR